MIILQEPPIHVGILLKKPRILSPSKSNIAEIDKPKEYITNKTEETINNIIGTTWTFLKELFLL